ncbi:hypothetical protein ACIRRH_39500 [Kitasatospora sp. NPDC101235]|uniref:hypothetical protein n=1 Tax=Kitasatospora sp. NPDC101235 TaxID=3364101 RepID=UPI0038044F60
MRFPARIPYGRELDENAHPDRLERQACDRQRRTAKGRPIILELPTARALRRAEKNGPPEDDPWLAA